MNHTITRPSSSTSMCINTIGLAVSLSVMLVVNVLKLPFFPITLAILCLSSYALTIIILEWVYLKTYNNPATGLNFSGPVNPVNPKRIAIKLLGFYGTLLFGSLFYWLFSHYDDPLYFHYFNLLENILPLLIVGCIPYFFLVDRYMTEPEDAYWQLGQLGLMNVDYVNRKTLWQHALAWLVKLFFLPIMFTYFYDLVLFFQATSLWAATISFKQFFDIAFKFLIFTDLMIGTVGYILTLRILDSHIRTTEPSFLGWFVALQCYQPFAGYLDASHLAYGTGYSWSYWLADYPLIYQIWGCLILILTTIFVWSSLPFGIRFSNLTHRGIITNGPYKYCKHPAYISKNLSWWLISMPFLSTVSPAEAIKHSLLLLLVNFVYFMRARTEERHLSWDPDYVDYAIYIEHHGIFSRIGERIPILKYRRHRLINIAD